MCTMLMFSANFYPRPPRGGRLRSRPLRSSGFDFYPRPPRGGRQVAPIFYSWYIRFLSTPSARRATSATRAEPSPSRYFYPRPPRGGRPPGRCGQIGETHISIHALREEGDPGQAGAALHGNISIHALREEGDNCGSLSTARVLYFYPRPPRGGRRRMYETIWNNKLFLSTPSARRATPRPQTGHTEPSHFYPRPPRGGRRAWKRPSRATANFYPRPPRGGRRFRM